MANQLRIKKGTLNGLKAITTKTPGTIYVTTDEKAMYVDISDTERIRLGQIITLDNTSDWENLEPPYSTDAFYYIVKKNALIKYTGSAWKQINAPTDLSDLTSRIGDLETIVGDADSGLVKDVNTLKTTVGDTNSGLVKDVADINKEIGENTSGTETGIYKLIADNTKAIGDNADAISDNADAILGLTTNLNTLSGAVGTTSDDKDANTAFGRIAKNAYDIAQNKTAIESNDIDIEKLNTTIYGNADGTQHVTNGLVKKVDKNTTDISTNADNITNLQGRMTTAENTITNHGATIDEHTTSINNLRTDLGNKSEDGGGNTSAFVRIADLRSKIATNASGIATNATNIGKNTTAINGLNTTVNEQGKAIDGLKSRVGATETDIEKLNTTIYGNADGTQHATAGLVNSVNNNATDIDTIEGLIGESTDSASASGSLYARIAYNKSQIESNDADITGLNNLIGTRSAAQGNKTAFQLIDEKVDKSTYEDGIADLESTLNSKILSANAMRYISTTGAIPTGTFSIGDTHVASTIIYNVPTDASGATTTTAYPGDLLIANGTEGTSGIIDPATLYWDVVDTGYNASHEDKLLLDNNVVSLKSYAGTPLGSVKFAGAGSTKVASAAAANGNPPTVTISVEWEDF